MKEKGGGVGTAGDRCVGDGTDIAEDLRKRAIGDGVACAHKTRR